MQTIKLPNSEDANTEQYVKQAQEAKEKHEEIILAIADNSGSKICMKLNSKNTKNDQDIQDAIDQLYTTLKQLNKSDTGTANPDTEKTNSLIEQYAIFFEIPCLRIKSYIGEGEKRESIRVSERYTEGGGKKPARKELSEEGEIIVLSLVLISLVSILLIIN